ncbi:MAG: protein of unknown function transrane [Clostridia bacterium]|nr:protein of unknown function transrane [Clostridia bacterium]
MVLSERCLIMENINIYLLLFISVIITLIYGILRNYYSKKNVKTVTDYYAFNFLSSILSTVILIALSGGIQLPSLYTLILGIIFGIVTALAAIANLQALNIGPMSYTSVIITASMIIPALSGSLIWNEQISIWQYIGMLLMVVSIAFSVDKKSNEKSSSVKWLLLCMTAFLFGGSIGIMQKFHQSSVYSEELSEFLIIAFLISTIFSFGMYQWYSKRKKIPKSISFSFKSSTFIMAVVSGIFIALANQINLYLSGVMNSAIFFPVVNGGGLLLTAIVAIVFFKEKLSKKQWFGLIIGIIAILLLCNLILF